MNPLENIVENMTAQHRVLQKDLSVALALAQISEINFEKIDHNLKKFALDLQGHLHLENEIFYPALIDLMNKKGLDISKTEEFINQMHEIGNALHAFLEKYNNTSAMSAQVDVFRQELAGVVSALNLRVESEESGVYGYWELYK